MKSNNITILLTIISIFFIIATYTSYRVELYKMDVFKADLQFESSASLMEGMIGYANKGLFINDANYSINFYNTRLNEILNVEKDLQQVMDDPFYQLFSNGEAESVLYKIERFKGVYLSQMNLELKQALINPNPGLTRYDIYDIDNVYVEDDVEPFFIYGAITIFFIILTIFSLFGGFNKSQEKKDDQKEEKEEYGKAR